jgi:hypothetical protein
MFLKLNLIAQNIYALENTVQCESHGTVSEGMITVHGLVCPLCYRVATLVIRKE